MSWWRIYVPDCPQLSPWLITVCQKLRLGVEGMKHWRPLKSPLRYPGAKKKVLQHFAQFWEQDHEEYRDVFVGGGSTFFGKPPAALSWLNDADEEVASFFVAMRDHAGELCDLVMSNKPSVDLWRDIKAKRLQDRKSTRLNSSH